MSKEFTQIGALDKWQSFLQQLITKDETTNSKNKEASTEFLNMFCNGIKWIRSGDINDPAKIPQNKSEDYTKCFECYSRLL